MKKNLSPSISILSLCLIAAIAATVFGVSMRPSRAAGFSSMIRTLGAEPQIKGNPRIGGSRTAIDANKPSAPLVGPVTVTATAGTLGPTDYATLKLAFDAINAGTHQGAITIDIVSSTTEGATPANLNSSGAGSAVYTSVLIRPANDGVSISGNPVTGFGVIQLNGADNVTIDGDNPNTGGTNRNLTVSNTTTTTFIANSAIRIATSAAVTSADNNTIKNCALLGNVTAGNAVAITSTAGSSNSSFGIYVGGNGGATATGAPTAITSVTANTAPTGTTINNLLIDNNTVNQCARAIVFNGAVATVSTGVTISNNVIGDQGATTPAVVPPYTAPSTTVYTKGIWVAGTAAVTVSGNTLKNILSYVGTTMTAIEMVSPVTASTISNNSATNIANNGTVSIVKAILISSTTGAYSIAGNSVTNVQALAGASGTDGIEVTAGSTGGTIERNKVQTVYNRNTGTFGAYGINLTSGTGIVIRNNFVSDINMDMTSGAAFSTTFGVHGIRIAGGTSHKVYHNSVNLFGALLGATNTSILTSAFTPTVATITGLDVRNNIFSNTMTGGTTSIAHVSMFLPSSATAGMGLKLNNNDYFAGTTAGSTGIAHVGAAYTAVPAGPATYAGLYTAANFDPTMTTPNTNLRVYTSTLGNATNDNASKVVDPLFVSNTDLHIAVASPMVDMGDPAVAVTTDIDGQLRVGNPDIGADEPSGVTPSVNDIAATAFISPTSGGTVGAGTAFTPQASFTNNGTAAQTNVPVRYKITDAMAVVVYNQTATIATISSGQTVTVSFPSATVASAGAYTIMASSELVGDQNTSNDSIMGTLTVVPPLSGPINVGTGETFTSLTNPGGIFEAINAAGASGNITVNITSNLTVETGVVALNQVAEAGVGGYTVTIKPSGAARTISGTSTPAGLIKLNGADRVTIDGSLSGGTDRNLTITNNNTAGVVIWIASASASNGATNDTVKNSNLSGSTGQTTVAAVLAGSGTTFGAAAESPNNNITIQNNVITKVQNAAFLFGNATTPDMNWLITGNTIGGTLAADKLGFRGFFEANTQDCTVSDNTITGISSSTVTSSTMSGIQIFGVINGGTISRNKISDVKQNNGAGWGSNGIYLTATSTTSNLTVSNNFISDVASQGFAGATSADNGYGIMIDTGAGYKIYDNTVSLSTNQVAAGSITAAINIAAAVTTAGGIDLRDNILADTQTIGTRYGVYDSSTAGATIFSSINYNDYFAQNVGFLTSARVTLANWQTATGQDVNSKAVDPVFVSSTDLHLQGSSTLISMGIAIAAVNDDVDTDLRDDTPDIGADETVMGRTGTIPAGTYRDANIGNSTLGGNVTITGTLTLSGILNTGANTLTIGCNATISGAGATNYVIGNLKKTFCSTGAFNFVVGTANGFSPVAVNVTAGTFPADFTVKATQGPQPNIGLPAAALQRYWTLTATGVTADLTFNYLDPTDIPMAADETAFLIFKYDGMWTAPGGTVNTVANSASITGVTTFSDWTLAEPGSPTDVALNSFTADGYSATPASPNGGALLRWQTGLEVANLGFNIYREEAGARVRVAPDMIAGSALFVGARTVLGAGRSYVWRDPQGANPDAQYWLESVDINGFSTWYGPVRSSGVKKSTTAFEPNSRVIGDLGQDQPGATTAVETKPKQARMSAASFAVQAVAASGPGVKIAVRREGWYRLSLSELVAAGLDARVDPLALQLLVDGQEQPINVLTSKEGGLSAIEFYGVGADSAYTSLRTYWLGAGAQPGKRIEQVKSAGTAPAGGSFPYAVERRDRTVYFSALRNGDKENFFGAVIARDAVDQSLTVQRLDAASHSAATLEVALQGVTTVAHSINVELNGTKVGAVTFNGQSGGVGQFNVPSLLLKEGQNVVRLTSQAGQGAVSLVDYIRLTYAHRYTAESNALRFTAAGRQQVTIDGFSSPDIRVLDVTNAGLVQELIGTVQPDKSGYAVALNVPGLGQRTLLAVAGETAKPVGVAANIPSTWRQPSNGADLIILTRRDFFAALDPLRSLRQKQGYSVALVDIEDVYDEFSYGQKTPKAVKDFCAYAAANWTKAPRFVMLAGDASLDPKNYLGFGDGDLVPTRLVDTQLMETASDDWLVDFNNDGLPDMAIGRLPVRSADEASRLAAKIAKYDGQRAADSLLLVNDRNDTFDFGSASNLLRGLIPTNIRIETVDRAHMDDAAAKALLIDAINRGQLIVNYTGHGSVNQWRGNILTSADAAGLTNGGELSLFVMMTCLNGYFQDAALDSLGESLLKADGGAMAVWGSSGMTTPDLQSTLNQQAYRMIFDGTALTIGEATARAKAAVASGDVRRTWILLGDPTTRLVR